MKQQGFRFGEWHVEVTGNVLRMGDTRVPLEPRAMDVLRYLCRHPGAVIPPEEILQACWGTPELGDNPIHKAIAQLRRALGDSSTEPRYIETVRKRGYRAIAEVVEEEAQAGIWHGGSPFRGLEAFEESHAVIFFGRAGAAGRLHDTVINQVDGGCAMALVLGPSGSGKTSLVRAGLLPRLTGGDGAVALACLLHMDCADLGGGDLFGALAAVLLDAELDGALLFDGADAASLGRQLRDEPDRVLARLPATGSIRLAVFVDRLEAIFRSSETDRAQFVRTLDILARANVLTVLACRNDFYPDLIALPELVALKARGGHFDVDPPAGADIAQMVREPARAAQLSFERDAGTGACLDDVLCDAARASPDALPLLQYCLDELYRQRGEDGLLRFEVFRKLGGIEGALGVRAEQIVAALSTAQQAALPHVLSLLVHIGEEQSAVTARRAPWSSLNSEAERELVQALVEARLFVSELTGNVPSFGVAHEALLRRWPRVVEWIERHRQSLQIRTRVAAQAERWVGAGRPRDLLLPAGLQANQARGLLDLKELSLSAREKEFVGASLSRVKIGERVRLGVMAVIALLAVLAGVLGVTARSAQKEAEQRRADAEGLMSFMLGDFVDKLRPLGRLDLLDDVSAKALKQLGSTDADNDKANLSPYRAQTLQLIAELNISRGKADSAEQALQHAHTTLLALLQQSPADKALLKLAGANAFWLGKIYMDRGDFSAARAHMDRYRATGETLVKLAPDEPESIQELSYALNNQGTVAVAQQDYASAAQAFEKSMELKRQLVIKKPADDTLRVDLSNSISWLARARSSAGELSEARILYMNEQEVLRALHAKQPSNGEWAGRLASSLSQRAEIEESLGDDAESVRLLDEAEQLLRGIVRADPTNLTQQKHRLVVKGSLLRARATIGESISLAEWRDLQSHLATLIAGEPGSSYLARVSLGIHINIAEYALRREDLLLARSEIDAGFRTSRSELVTIDKDPRVRPKLAQLTLIDADLLRAAGSVPESEKKCAAAQEIMAPVRGTTSDFVALATIVRAHACAGKLADVAVERRKLEAMHYRASTYLNYLSTHQ